MGLGLELRLFIRHLNIYKYQENQKEKKKKDEKKKK